jgi:hypothetical protein
MAYVYRHIRLDKNQPFYIGIGKDVSYKRAYDKTRRNNFWRNVVSKTDYCVEIIMDGLTWEQACEKEKEFISIYGRKDLGKGTLVNLTDGGEGGLGAIRDKEQMKRLAELNRGRVKSEETRRKISESNKGKKLTEEQKKKISDSMKGKQNTLGFKHSKEFSDMLKELHKGNQYNVGRKRTEEFKQKISTSTKGKILSEETRKKISQALKGNKNCLGRKLSQETKEKIGKANKR